MNKNSLYGIYFGLICLLSNATISYADSYLAPSCPKFDRDEWETIKEASKLDLPKDIYLIFKRMRVTLLEGKSFPHTGSTWDKLVNTPEISQSVDNDGKTVCTYSVERKLSLVGRSPHTFVLRIN